MYFKDAELTWEYIRHDPDDDPLDHWKTELTFECDGLSYGYISFSIMNHVGYNEYTAEVCGWSWDSWYDLGSTTTLEEAKTICQNYLYGIVNKFMNIFKEN